ncbi:MAG: hypothetical protein M1546_24600 [Chloroflexi bacterium]|nr:hypothetical protein [Chloroflexota bacterium]
MLRHFEPQGMGDWLLIPWWLLRYGLAWLVWQAMTLWRLAHGEPRAWAWMWGRHDDPEPVLCERCLWAGPRAWTIHAYHACGDDDVEPVDECPRCGADI